MKFNSHCKLLTKSCCAINSLLLVCKSFTAKTHNVQTHSTSSCQMIFSLATYVDVLVYIHAFIHVLFNILRSMRAYLKFSTFKRDILAPLSLSLSRENSPVWPSIFYLKLNVHCTRNAPLRVIPIAFRSPLREAQRSIARLTRERLHSPGGGKKIPEIRLLLPTCEVCEVP